MPTYGHGQGYSDLNFLIPEVVDSVRYKKGTYYADEGDFSAAGAAEADRPPCDGVEILGDPPRSPCG